MKWSLLFFAALTGSGAAPPPPRVPAAPAPQAAPPVQQPVQQEVFVDRAREMGIDFTHVNGMTGAFYMPEIMGPGVALFDFDGDGDLDLFLVQGGPLGHQGPGGKQSGAPPKLNHALYRNDLRKGADGRMEAHFTDVTAESGITLDGYAMGAAVGDYDNDGRPDLYITGLEGGHLWHNNGPNAAGKVTFTDVTARAGVADPAWSVSATFFDYDRDGWLDLYVGNYLKFSFAAKPCRTPAGAPDWCGPIPSDAQPGRLFHNRGDGTFEDVTVKSGLAADYGPALGVSTADFDGDGWIDLYVANDATQNQLWRNQHNGTFRNDGLIAGCALNADGKAQASMGVDAGDYDGDGDEDLVMDNLTGEGDTLYRNDGAGMFEDVTLASGLYRASLPYTGFGAAWLDYDNDSWLDLLTVNGAVRSIEEQAHAGSPLPLRQGKQLFHNLGDRGRGRFEDVTAAAGAVLARPEVSRGAAFGDIDNDGDTDVVVANNNGRPLVLVNQVGSRKPWLGLRLLTGKPGRDALGARVGVVRPGAPTLWRRARADGSYASANDPRVLVGLGDKAEVSRVIVKWPSGRVEEWPGSPGLPLNAYTTLHEGTGKAMP